MPDVSFVRALWVAIFTLFYFLLDLSCGGCNVISLYFLCVTGSVCLVRCVFVNCLVKQFATCLGVVPNLLLTVMEVLMWMEVLCWKYSVWSSKECVWCAFDPRVLHRFCLYLCMSEVISSFRSSKNWCLLSSCYLFV